MPFRLLILIVPLLLYGSYCFGNETERLVLENRNLEAERKAARTTNIYLVFNLSEKYIQIKSKGVILKNISIKKINYWGSLPQGELMVLKNKNVFMKPRRDKVTPGKNNDTTSSELDALEIEDMPSRYTLQFDKGVYISIQTDTLFSTIRTLFPSINDLILRPVLTVWYRIWQKPYIVIEITLNEQDVKALYWSSLEGIQGILYPP